MPEEEEGAANGDAGEDDSAKGNARSSMRPFMPFPPFSHSDHTPLSVQGSLVARLDELRPKFRLDDRFYTNEVDAFDWDHR